MSREEDHMASRDHAPSVSAATPEEALPDNLDPDYVILKMGVQIDVRKLEKGYIVEGLKFKSGRKSVFAPEHLLSQEMDALLLKTFKKQIAAAFAAKPAE